MGQPIALRPFPSFAAESVLLWAPVGTRCSERTSPRGAARLSRSLARPRPSRRAGTPRTLPRSRLVHRADCLRANAAPVEGAGAVAGVGGGHNQPSSFAMRIALESATSSVSHRPMMVRSVNRRLRSFTEYSGCDGLTQYRISTKKPRSNKSTSFSLTRSTALVFWPRAAERIRHSTRCPGSSGSPAHSAGKNRRYDRMTPNHQGGLTRDAHTCMVERIRRRCISACSSQSRAGRNLGKPSLAHR